MVKKMFSWLRPRSEAAESRTLKSSRHFHVTNPWHAVSIAAGKGSCQAAVTLKRRRFLAGEAPRLPLEPCDQPGRCTCVYKHFSDRRAASRRATENGAIARPQPRAAASNQSQERRRSKGRRATDGL